MAKGPESSTRIAACEDTVPALPGVVATTVRVAGFVGALACVVFWWLMPIPMPVPIMARESTASTMTRDLVLNFLVDLCFGATGPVY